MNSTPTVAIPSGLLPNDGRFCAGPSLVRQEAVLALADIAPRYLGTSHRQDTVKDIVGALREGFMSLFGLPDDWEIVLGNGGTTLFWDAATFGLIDAKSQHLSFGEFSSKFAKAVGSCPHLGDPHVIESDPGTAPEAVAADGVDLYALTHNETSTGVSVTPRRPAGTTADDALVAVDATSAAGGMHWDPSEVDVYYFAPQKCFASDGGLFVAACSPAAVARIERIAASDRWRPAGLDLGIALDNSRKNQTYNTPALATIYLTLQQVEWMNGNGGLDWAAGRSSASSDVLYSWADNHERASAFVTDPALRSPVVVTVDIDDAVSADTIVDICRQNGILDIGGYRKLGRNQLRIATFPAIETADVQALTGCIDHIIEALL